MGARRAYRLLADCALIRRALCLGGAAAAQLAKHRVAIGGFWADLGERYLAPVRGEPGSEPAWERGQSLSLEKAVARALSVPSAA